MFGLFKKKKEDPIPVPASVAEQETVAVPEEDTAQAARKEFLARFPEKETDLVGITSPGGVAHEPVEGTDLFHVAIGLTAWLDEYEQELHQEPATLEAMVDETLLDYLRQRTPSNFIISAVVRPAGDGKHFLITDLPKPGFDPALKALLEEQKKPVTLEVDGLGSFSLNRNLGWYDATVEWLGEEISLNLDQSEETLACAQETAKNLMENQENWDNRVRVFAAEQLLAQVNTLVQSEDGDAELYTVETLAEQFQLDSVLAGPDGTFEFWFSDDDLFLAHPVHVTGTLEQGPNLAEMDD